ncbi:MAG: glycerophosphodiester phosphodiesterase family protein [Nanoarchaeota archaeon]
MNSKLPLIMAHAGGDKYFQENSLKAINQSNKLKPDIIELDVRKSKDNVLFCHHGKILLGLLKAYFSSYRKFDDIKKGKTIFTLEKILSEIKNNPIMYLDIKDKRINAKDIENVFRKAKFSRVYIASYSKKYLVNLKNVLGKKYLYAYQHPIFFIKSFIKRYKGKINMVKIFRWEKKYFKELKKQGFQPKLYYSFYSKKRYIEDSIKLKSLYICTGDTKKTRELMKKLLEIENVVDF